MFSVSNILNIAERSSITLKLLLNCCSTNFQIHQLYFGKYLCSTSNLFRPAPKRTGRSLLRHWIPFDKHRLLHLPISVKKLQCSLSWGSFPSLKLEKLNEDSSLPGMLSEIFHKNAYVFIFIVFHCSIILMNNNVIFEKHACTSSWSI